jgi:hypothetical protein
MVGAKGFELELLAGVRARKRNPERIPRGTSHDKTICPAHLLLMHGCVRSVRPLSNLDCEHKNRRQAFRPGRFLRR